MKKTLFGIMFVVALLVPSFVFGAVGCDCTIKLKVINAPYGPCEINKNVVFEIDQTFTVEGLLKTYLNDTCKKYINLVYDSSILAQPINQKNTSCTFLEQKNIADYNYKLTCNSVSLQGAKDDHHKLVPGEGIYKWDKGQGKWILIESLKKPAGQTTADFSELKSHGDSLNKLGKTSIQTFIGNIIQKAMGIMGSIALVMIMYGGILWMVAGGNADKSKKSLQIIIWSALGIAVIFASYALVDMVFKIF